jgi:hypothetical protein
VAKNGGQHKCRFRRCWALRMLQRSVAKHWTRRTCWTGRQLITSKFIPCMVTFLLIQRIASVWVLKMYVHTCWFSFQYMQSLLVHYVTWPLNLMRVWHVVSKPVETEEQGDTA